MNKINFNEMTLAEIFLLLEECVTAYMNRRKILFGTLSSLDRELNIVAHEIETGTPNVVGGFRLFEQFRELRRARRVVKNDIDFDDEIRNLNVDIGKMKFDISKGKKSYKASDKYRNSQQEYLNQDKLRYMGWEQVFELSEELVPKHGIVFEFDIKNKSKAGQNKKKY